MNKYVLREDLHVDNDGADFTSGWRAFQSSSAEKEIQRRPYDFNIIEN